MEAFGRSPEYNKMLSHQEEIQQVLYPQCGLMKCPHGGWGSKGGGGGGIGNQNCALERGEDRYPRQRLKTVVLKVPGS